MHKNKKKAEILLQVQTLHNRKNDELFHRFHPIAHLSLITTVLACTGNSNS